MILVLLHEFGDGLLDVAIGEPGLHKSRCCQDPAVVAPAQGDCCGVAQALDGSELLLPDGTQSQLVLGDDDGGLEEFGIGITLAEG